MESFICLPELTSAIFWPSQCGHGLQEDFTMDRAITKELVGDETMTSEAARIWNRFGSTLCFDYYYSEGKESFEYGTSNL